MRQKRKNRAFAAQKVFVRQLSEKLHAEPAKLLERRIDERVDQLVRQIFRTRFVINQNISAQHLHFNQPVRKQIADDRQVQIPQFFGKTPVNRFA